MLFEKIELEPSEEVLKIVRKHWFVIVSQLFGSFLMLFFPFFVLFLVALFPSVIAKFDFSLSHYTSLITFGIAADDALPIMTTFAFPAPCYGDDRVQDHDRGDRDRARLSYVVQGGQGRGKDGMGRQVGPNLRRA